MVPLLVLIAIGAPTEGTAALGTREGPLTGVRVPVANEVAVALEGLTTVMADVGLLA